MYVHVNSAQIQCINMAPCPFEEAPTCYPHRIKRLHLSILPRMDCSSEYQTGYTSKREAI